MTSRSVKYVRPYNINDRVVCRRRRRRLLLLGRYYIPIMDGDETRAAVADRANSLWRILLHAGILYVFESKSTSRDCDIIRILYYYYIVILL